jgi:hypothetical protein
MSETYDGGETYARGGQDETRAAGVILMVTGLVAAFLVIAGLIYAAGASGRHKAALAAADCEPSLFITGLPCTTQQMVLSQYEGIATPASKQLKADMAAYRASERRNLVAAEAALTAEVTMEQALDNSLAAVAFTPQNRATALALITSAVSSGNPVPSAAVTFTPQTTVIVDALVQANQALAKLTAEQARSSSLGQLRSFNHRVQAADAAVQTEMNLLRKALATPPTANQEP